MVESGEPITIDVYNGIGDSFDPNTFKPSHKFTVSFSYNSEADFDNNGSVNMNDYAKFSRDWMKEGNLLTDMSGPEGKSDGRVDVYDLDELSGKWLYNGDVGNWREDISGPNGLPDGKVDMYDFAKFSGDYGKSVE